MERTRIWRRRDKIYRARPARLADVGDRKAIAEHMADKGMPLMDHDLHAVAAAVLVGMAYEFNIARRHRDHAAPPLRGDIPKRKLEREDQLGTKFSHQRHRNSNTRHSVGGAISSRARPRASGPIRVTAIAAIATMTASATKTTLRPKPV